MNRRWNHLLVLAAALAFNSVRGEHVEVVFPQDRSLGRLYSRPAGCAPETAWLWFDEARGTVAVAPGTEVRLDVSLAAGDDLAPLALLKGSPVVMINLEGTGVGDDKLAPLADLDSLVTLWLCRTRLTDRGLAHLAGLRNLRELNLWGTFISDAGLEHLRGLSSLERLSLRHCGITSKGLGALGEMQSLAVLDLEGTRVGEGTAGMLGRIKSLRALNVSGSAMDLREVTRLARLGSLQHLHLRGILRGEGVNDALRVLARLEDLRGLDVSQGDVDDTGIEILGRSGRRIESLQLAGCRLTGRSLDALRSMGSLRFLNLYDTGLGEHDIEKLAADMPHCQIIR